LYLPNPTLLQLLSDEHPYIEMFVEWMTHSQEEPQEAKRIAMESMAVWRTLHKYSQDVSRSDNDGLPKKKKINNLGSGSATERTKRLAEELQRACSEEGTCLSWLRETEMYEDLMHLLEEEVVEEEEEEVVVVEVVEELTYEARSGSATESTEGTQEAAAAVVVDARSLTSVCDVLEQLMEQAYLLYLHYVSKRTRLIPKVWGTFFFSFDTLFFFFFFFIYMFGFLCEVT
jgi:hypothetical protein